jgi:hypothetical protein
MRMTACDVRGLLLIKPLEADLDNRQRVLSSPDTD